MNFNLTKKNICLLLLGVFLLVTIVLIRSCSHEEEKFVDSNNDSKDEISSIIDDIEVMEDIDENQEVSSNESGELSQQDNQNTSGQNNENLSTQTKPHKPNPEQGSSSGSSDNKPNEDNPNNDNSQDKDYWSILFNEIEKANKAFEYLLNLTEEALN